MSDLEQPSEYIIGCDLGQASDFTGITILSPDGAELPTFNLGYIERIPIKTRYPRIVEHLGRLVDTLREPVPVPSSLAAGTRASRFATMVPDVVLVVDYTGVGRPVADMIIDAQFDCEVRLVTITAGNTVVIGEGGEFRVPKRDLASVIQRLLQESRLILPEKIELADGRDMTEVITTELTGFRVKLNARGHDSYGAGDDWRSAPHDDLVLALALACWWGEHWQSADLW